MAYFTIYQSASQVTFFHIDIKKDFRYSAHGIEYHDYSFYIGEINMPDEEQNNFDNEYGGYFLWLNEEREIKIYDNINKTFFDIDNIPDLNHLHFIYNHKTYGGISLVDLVKELLFDIFVTSSQI